MVTGAPSDNPAFLNRERAEATPYAGAAPDTKPAFDQELIAETPKAPSRGLINRYREIARLHALGKTNNDICAVLGYTPSRMSIILQDPFVQDEIARVRERLFDQDVTDKLKEAAKDGARLAHEIILDPKEKSQTRLDAAKWSVEKVHGKARQEINIESNVFVSILQEMKQNGELRDVTPAVTTVAASASAEPVTPPDKWDTWLDTNL